MREQPTTLYRLYDHAGALLYVGIAGNPGRRFEQHRGDKPWWGEVDRITLQHFPHRPAAVTAELAAIRTERPRHNVIGATGTLGIAPVRHTGRWVYQSLHSGLRFERDLYLYWELPNDPISDNYSPGEIDAYDLWSHWAEGLGLELNVTPLGPGWLPIYWFVVSDPAGHFELAPHQPHPGGLRDFLDIFTPPYRKVTRESLNWLTLPVADKRWTPDRGDKGGFVQEITGWKPSPLQPYVNLPLLAAAADLPLPTSVVPVR